MGLWQAHTSSGTHTDAPSLSPKNLVEGVGNKMLLLIAA